VIRGWAVIYSACAWAVKWGFLVFLLGALSLWVFHTEVPGLILAAALTVETIRRVVSTRLHYDDDGVDIRNFIVRRHFAWSDIEAIAPNESPRLAKFSGDRSPRLRFSLKRGSIVADATRRATPEQLWEFTRQAHAHGVDTSEMPRADQTP
jgi:hypothetical protein